MRRSRPAELQGRVSLADRILVLGGYGVFGGRLARRLVQQTNAEIIVAGRSRQKAEAHCNALAGRRSLWIVTRSGNGF